MVLEPASTKTIEVRFRPKQPSGGRSGRIRFSIDGDPPRPGLVVLDAVAGGPEIAVEPGSVAFGTLPYFPGHAARYVRPLIVRNVGSRPPDSGSEANLHIHAHLVNPVPGTTQDEFSLDATNYDGTRGVDPGIGGAGLSVVFSPRGSGTRAADLTIISNDAENPTIQVPLDAHVVQVPSCGYAISPPSLDFGTLTAGTTVQLPVRFENISVVTGQDCIVSSIELAPGTPQMFTIRGAPKGSAIVRPQHALLFAVEAVVQTVTSHQSVIGSLRFSVSSSTHPSWTIPITADVVP